MQCYGDSVLLTYRRIRARSWIRHRKLATSDHASGKRGSQMRCECWSRTTSSRGASSRSGAERSPCRLADIAARKWRCRRAPRWDQDSSRDKLHPARSLDRRADGPAAGAAGEVRAGPAARPAPTVFAGSVSSENTPANARRFAAVPIRIMTPAQNVRACSSIRVRGQLPPIKRDTRSKQDGGEQPCGTP
jgi:hypothetical protein